MATRSIYSGNNLMFYDNVYSSARGGVWDNCPLLPLLCYPENGIIYYDNFTEFDQTATVGNWVQVTDAAGTTGLNTSILGGALNINATNTDNNETYELSASKAFKFAASKPLWFEAKIQLTEANTDDANFIIGLSSTGSANTLVDDGGGPPSNYSGAVFFKVDGGTVFQFETSNATTQNTTTNAGAFVSATAYRVGFRFDPNDGTTGKVTPYIDGVAGTTLDITLASAAAMGIVMGVKAGGANAETLTVHHVRCVQIL